MRLNTTGNPPEIFLQPGQLHFGGDGARLRTVLGSCISVTVWHPQRRIGGMCHFMLPGARRQGRELDGRYAEDALQWLACRVRACGTAPAEYETKVFGGGRMNEAGRPLTLDVAGRNVESARRLIAAHDFRLRHEHLAGRGHRNIVFDLTSGDVWVKHVPPRPPPATYTA